MSTFCTLVVLVVSLLAGHVHSQWLCYGGNAQRTSQTLQRALPNNTYLSPPVDTFVATVDFRQPVVDAQGSLYYLDQQHNLVQYNTSNYQRTNLCEIDGNAQTIVLDNSGNHLYLLDDSGLLRSFSRASNGTFTPKFTISTHQYTNNSNADLIVDQDANVYITGANSQLTAISYNGTFKWSLKVAEIPSLYPLNSNALFVVLNSSTVASVDLATGKLLWQTQLPLSILVWNTIAVNTAANLTYYMSANYLVGSFLFAVNSTDGRIVWYKYFSYPDTTTGTGLALDSSLQTLYIYLVLDTTLLTLDAITGEPKKPYTTSSGITALAVTSDHHLYIVGQYRTDIVDGRDMSLVTHYSDIRLAPSHASRLALGTDGRLILGGYNYTIYGVSKCPYNCSNNGVCNEATGLCSCSPNFYTPDCSQECVASITCHGHGSCSSNGTCVCRMPFVGATCSQCAEGYYTPQCIPVTPTPSPTYTPSPLPSPSPSPSPTGPKGSHVGVYVGISVGCGVAMILLLLVAAYYIKLRRARNSYNTM